MTGPRRAVISALAGADGHLTAEEVVGAVEGIDAGVHRASVYRSLEALSQLGVVQHVHVSHGPTTYHLVADGASHPHAQCRVCGAVVDLPPDVLAGAGRRVRREMGFELDAEHVALSGRCASCASIANKSQ